MKILTDEQIADARRGKTAKKSLRAICEAQAEMSRAEESESSEISIQQAYEAGIETGEQRGREAQFVEMVECMWECDLLTREWYDSVFELWRKELTNHWAEWLVGCALELKAKLEKAQDGL